MKRIFFYIVLLCVASGAGVSVSLAATSTLSSAAPIVGTAAWENAGNLTFDYEVWVPWSNEVSINANTLDFAGTFWSENVGWVTFSSLGANGAKLTGNTNTMPMIGFAWSENAGWISFNPRNTVDATTYTNSDVFFDKAQGKFHGFAWSENLGWINMEGLMTDITAPDLTTNFQPFAANGSKVFTTNASPVTPSGWNYTFAVDNWNGGAHTYAETTPSFTHDFRQAKLYYLKVTDPFGNSSEGNVQVVADVPSDTLSAQPISASATASIYTGTFADSRVGDATQVHSMDVKLRDQYGNPVITEPGIKQVTARVSFNNNVDKNQLLSIGWVIGDAIQFPGNTFGWLTYLSESVGSADNTTGNYALDISSYAPTKAGYSFTNPNNISLQKLTYEVSANTGNAWVGEVTETHKESAIGTNSLRFSPALFIGNVTNTDNWSIRQGYDTAFSAQLSTGTNVSLTSVQAAHILDIKSHATDLIGNLYLSYQNPSNITGGSKVCEGYEKTVTTFNGAYTSTDSKCDKSSTSSSNLLIDSANLGSAMGFSWKPTIIIASPKNNVVTYASEITYANGGQSVAYPSYARSTNSNTLADGTAVTTTDGVINQSVKILGMTSSRSAIDVLEGNNTNKVGSLTRTDIKNAIHKNVEMMTKWGVSPSAKYEVHTGDYTIPATWPVGKDTIIVKWWDVTIGNNIANEATIKGIIVLRNDAGMGGRIYINKNVSNVAAVLYADKSIISGNSTTYYSDISPSSQTATGQLLIEGSIISDNTIGWASMTPLKCPYGAGICDDREAKRYDLNYFRFYTGTGASSPGSAAGVPSGGIGYPTVIKYDNRIQTAPPSGFRIQK